MAQRKEKTAYRIQTQNNLLVSKADYLKYLRSKFCFLRKLITTSAIGLNTAFGSFPWFLSNQHKHNMK
jgi:hypothetical protein